MLPPPKDKADLHTNEKSVAVSHTTQRIERNRPQHHPPLAPKSNSISEPVS